MRSIAMPSLSTSLKCQSFKPYSAPASMPFLRRRGRSFCSSLLRKPTCATVPPTAVLVRCSASMDRGVGGLGCREQPPLATRMPHYSTNATPRDCILQVDLQRRRRPVPLQPVRTDARGRRRRTAAAAMEGADPAASTGVFALDYEALGLNRYHRHEVEDAADGGSGAVNPNSIEAREGRLDDAVAATQLRFREGNKDSMYVPGPDAVEKDGAPAGEMISFKNWSSSTVYPDTTRDWHIYIPAAYSAAAQPAKLMVFNDGVFYFPKSGPARATIVFDNLIASGEMPVTIGVFVNPGLRDGRDRDIYQRSVE
jgi:hypothetical protein